MILTMWKQGFINNYLCNLGSYFIEVFVYSHVFMRNLWHVDACVHAGKGTDTEARGNCGWQKCLCHFLPKLEAAKLICPQ